MSLSCSIQSTIVEAWAKILPKDIHLSAGSLMGEFPSLTEVELASVGVVDFKRMNELKAGRMHAKLALAEVNCFNVDLPLDKSSGAPLWPKGINGSITHTQYLDKSHVAAVVANSSSYIGFGIDAEWNAAITPNIWEYFLTPEELNWLALEPVVERTRLVHQIWCLKEAAIKVSGGERLAWQTIRKSTGVYDGLFELNNLELNNKFIWSGRAIHLEDITLAIIVADFVDKQVKI